MYRAGSRSSLRGRVSSVLGNLWSASRRRTLRVEALEDRRLLSVLGGDLHLTIDVESVCESDGAGAATATVTRTASTVGSMVLDLASSDPTEAVVPATVTIPDGSASATFSIDAVDDMVIDDNQTVNISAVTQDRGFAGPDGVVTVPLTSTVVPPSAVFAQQTDGKTIVAATFNSAIEADAWQIIRLNADGTTDGTFGTGGIVRTSGAGNVEAILIQPDGRFLVGGSGYGGPALACYHPDGTLDASFGSNGFAELPVDTGWVGKIVLRPDGEIVLGIGVWSPGNARVAQLHADGTPDLAFGAGGVADIVSVIATLGTMAIQEDGRILVTGQNSDQVVRLLPDGTLDASFGIGGIVTIDSVMDAQVVSDVAIDSSGRIVLAGRAYDHSNFVDTNLFAARLSAEGSLDFSFGGDGSVVTDFFGGSDWAETVLLQEDGKVVIVGTTDLMGSDDLAIVRYNADGSLDSSLDGDGRYIHSLFAGRESAMDAFLQDDGNLQALVGGDNGVFRVARYGVDVPLGQAFDTLVVTDDEGLIVTETEGSTRVSETGTTDTFSVRLGTAPSSNVVIMVTSDDEGEVIANRAFLTFTPADWNVAQTVTVTGVDDWVVDGDQETSIRLSIDDANSDDPFDSLIDQTVSVVTTDFEEFDFGDAPDMSTGTGVGDYNTVENDNGARHLIVPGLHMGVSVDGDDGTLQNSAANADDMDQLPNDEDGLIDPATDMALTLGAQPSVRVIVTNTTGSPATLSGWIDYNGDGVFDSVTERAQAVVPDGTTGGTVTLVFPRLLTEYTGDTYARFRLSTDPAASDPTGRARDGEVEDYVATISGVPGIDLQGMGFDVVPDNLLDGPGTANVEFSIRNLGDATAGAFDVQFYLSDDAIIDPTTDILLSLDSSDPNYDSSEPEAFHVAGLASAGRHEGVVTLSVPQPDPLGTDNEYFLGMFVDADGDIVESNEANNHSLGQDLDLDDVEFTVGPFDHFEWDLVASPQSRGVPFTVRVEATDSNGWTVPSYNDTVELSGWGGGGTGTVEILSYIAYADTSLGGEYQHTLQAISTYFANYNETSTTVTDPVALEAALVGIDVFLIPEQERTSSGRMGALGTAWSTVLGNFVSSGGTVIACSYYQDEHMILQNSGLMTLNSRTYVSSLSLDKPADTFLNAGVSTPFNARYVHEYSATTNGEVSLQGETTGNPVVLSREVGWGHVIMIGTDYYTLGTDMDRVIANAVQMANRGVSVAVTPSNTDHFINGVWTGDVTVLELAEDMYLRVDDGSGHVGATNTFDVIPGPGNFDFGDAPDPGYPTLFANEGARHHCSGPTLGSLRDGEDDGSPSTNADGDDDPVRSDDEDGVTFGSIQVGRTDAVVTVNVQNAPSGAKLDAWIDFNGDGSWGGPGERIATGLAVVEGDNAVAFDVPTWAASGATYARFRLSTIGGLAPGGEASDGEVEDYVVSILSPVPASGVFGSQELIATDADGVASVFSADLDGDGDSDMLSALLHSGEIIWYENIGGGVFGGQQVITDAANAASSVFAADLDGDGDLDVLSASAFDDKIAWYENAGGGTFGGQQIITTDADYASSVFAGDLDGDGDLDVLSASAYDDKIAWYENTGGGTFGGQQIITTDADHARSVFAVDLDGDGYLDAISASSWDNKIAWYRNSGDGVFGTERIITTGAAMVEGVYAADLDGDGDMDVLSASALDDKIAWYENLGAGAFGSQRVITTDAEEARSVFAVDLDGDGDTDVVSASSGDGKIAWYENYGVGIFSAQHVITTDAGFAVSAVAADLDGDGDQDVFSASVGDDKIAWYRNAGFDFGDAPAPYPARLADGGASHSPVGPTLGNARDDEQDGLPTGNADGDDANGTIDDEDGVTAEPLLAPGIMGTTLTVDVSAPSFLNAWIDFNRDGVWESSEQVAVDLPMVAGANTVAFDVPASAVPGLTYARLRLTSYDTGGTLAPTGPADDGEVEDYAWTIGERADVLGSTDGDDVISVRLGVVGGAQHEVRVNGTVTRYDPAVVFSISIDGLGGKDRITVYGTDQNETARLEVGAVRVVGETYVVQAGGVEDVTVYADAGDDRVTMTGSAGANRLYSYAGYARLADSARTFSYRVDGFEEVTVDVASGGRNYAYLNDSPGGDVLDASPDRTVLHRAVGTADATVTTANGFERVYGYATEDGDDTATLTGVTDARNRFYSYADYSILTESRRSFYFYARGFDEVMAESPGDGYSYAYLYDSSGADEFEATPTSATMDRAEPWSDTTATGFMRVYAYSTRGGDDAARLIGSAVGGNQYRGYPTRSTLTDGARSFYHDVRGFGSVTAEGSTSGAAGDRAYLYDSSGADTLVGRGESAIVKDTAEAVYEIEALYFDRVYARSSDRTANDTVDVDDSLVYELIRLGVW